MPVERPAIPAPAHTDISPEEIATRVEHNGVQVEHGALQYVPDLSQLPRLRSERRHWKPMLRHTL
jgi:hypothetical protein